MNTNSMSDRKSKFSVVPSENSTILQCKRLVNPRMKGSDNLIALIVLHFVLSSYSRVEPNQEMYAGCILYGSPIILHLENGNW